MKFKDIEKKLKREQDNTAVPDVYARVSKAPLNKLLSGETPARAFQKQLVMRLLTIVLILFSVMAIGLSAIWLSPSDTQSAPECYVSVTITSNGKDTRLGIVMSGNKKIISIVKEMTDGELNAHPLVSHSSQISDFITPKLNDKVHISLLSNIPTALTEGARFIAGELETAYNKTAFEMTTTANLSKTREEIVSYITACGGNADSSDSIPTLIQTYAKLFN